MHDLLTGRMIHVEVIDFYLKLLMEKNWQTSHVIIIHSFLNYFFQNQNTYILPSHLLDYSRSFDEESDELKSITV